MTRNLALLGLALLLPLQAGATCALKSREAFQPFFAQFSTNKAFALQRTKQPLKLLRHEVGMENDRAVTSTVETVVPPNEYAALPPLTTIARQRGMTLQLGYHKNRADPEEDAFEVVTLSKPNTDWLLTYHFERTGNCWRLQHVEDHSL